MLKIPSYEGTLLLRVREVFETGNFKLPIFLLEGYYADSIIWERGPKATWDNTEAVTDYGLRGDDGRE